MRTQIMLTVKKYFNSVIFILFLLNIIYLLKTQSEKKLAKISRQSQLASINEVDFVLELTLENLQKIMKENPETLKKILVKTDTGIDITKQIQQYDGLNFKIQFEKMANFSKSQVDSRKNLLRSLTTYFYDLYGSLAPEVYCLNKVRIGTIGDGGKWVCNPWNVPNDCVIFSLGLSNSVGFDVDFQKLISNRCQVFGFDSSEQNDETKTIYSSIRGKTMKALISLESDPTSSMYSIADLAKMNNVKNIEILKIDIEGAEHTALIPFLNQFTVCQIFIEIHGNVTKHRDLLNKIGKLQYRLFSYEVNGAGVVVCEYSFIHDSCVKKYEAIPVANYLDF